MTPSIAYAADHPGASGGPVIGWLRDAGGRGRTAEHQSEFPTRGIRSTTGAREHAGERIRVGCGPALTCLMEIGALLIRLETRPALNLLGTLSARNCLPLRFQAAKQARSGFTDRFHALSSSLLLHIAFRANLAWMRASSCRAGTANRAGCSHTAGFLCSMPGWQPGLQRRTQLTRQRGRATMTLRRWLGWLILSAARNVKKAAQWPKRKR